MGSWTGFLKLALAHHPVCYFYQNHVIRLPLLKNFPLCLGCTGFYPGLLIFFWALGNPGLFVWETAALTALVLMLPTVVRLFFDLDSGRKWLRFASKLLLGLGVGLGIYSILLSTDILIQLFQLTFGIAVYAGIAYRKSKNPYPECGPCSYNPSRVCPGIGPFYGIDILNTVPMADTDQFRLNSRDSA